MNAYAVNKATSRQMNMEWIIGDLILQEATRDVSESALKMEITSHPETTQIAFENTRQ